jgi:Family of unknown function (DUF5985)
MAQTVYILCGLTSLFCAVLLLRQYRHSKSRLLFWSGLCFVCFTATNILLFVDIVIFPEIDMSVYRSGISLLGIVMLLYGLIWETR